jgi:iron-sulfur cluster repair protein YtfE (RIC family)
MTTDAVAADTRIMGVVHDALRRDLARSRRALTEDPAPDDRRRVAIAGHVSWMMDFLRAHHRGEDDGLWPLVERRNPAAKDVLAAMDAEHRLITPAVTVVDAAASTYRESARREARLDLARALDSLNDVLLPHLRREEDEVMPLVSASISQADWQSWDQATNIKTKSPIQLADEGHWLIDDLDPVRRALVTHLVPAIPRFVLVHGFAGRYRRQAAKRWTRSVRAGAPTVAGTQVP